MTSHARASAAPSFAPPFAEAIRVFARIGLLSFGGPAGQIALMHSELVERRRWIDDERFLHALNYCMLLPGPEATQLATYVGWLMYRAPGGIAAGVLFVLPGFVSILGLSLLYAGLGQLPAVAALFFGLKSAVLAVVIEAVLRVGRRALKSRFLVAVAGLAFVALFGFAVPFPIMVVTAGLLGIAVQRFFPALLPQPEAEKPIDAHDSVIARMARAGELEHTRPSRARDLKVLASFALLWGLPLLGLALFCGTSSIYFREGVFFSKTAVVTFGGAYAVLAYVAQQAVQNFNWLKPGEMLDGLGLAETTPGPLIMVVQFVAFLGAFRHGGAVPPLWAGVFGSIVTVWVTFVPCFLWIFLGAPYIEALRGNRMLRAGLSTITAAVVGVILNLSVWFGLHVVFEKVTELKAGPISLAWPEPGSVNLAASLLAVASLLALFRFKLGLPKTLLASATLGLLYKLLIAN